MKFGKYLARRLLDLPEYADHFIDYKALKKLINRLAVTPPPATEGNHPETPKDVYRRLQEQKARFFFQLERELEKVQTFYQSKERDLELRLDILLQKKAATQIEGTLTKKSVAYISLHGALQRFRRDLEQLEQFTELNATGFSKVLKKWDKRSRSHTKELYLSRAIEPQPMFNREVLVALNDLVTNALLELEALDTGETVVFEATPAVAQASNPTDDLCYEFIKFASSADPESEEFAEHLHSWVEQLKAVDQPRERITQVFLLALATKTSREALTILYDSGFVDLHAVDEVNSRNCLHIACATTVEDRTFVVERGIAENVSAASSDVYRRTPLHYAAISGHHSLFASLVRAGAPIDQLDVENFSALHYAIFYDNPECVTALLELGAQVEGDADRHYIPLNFACQYGALDSVKSILGHYPRLPMVADAEGLYPLHIVARAGFYEIVPLLVKAGADVNMLDKLNDWSPLMYAASEGMHRTVKMLLSFSADWQQLDERGHSALFYACWEGHPVSLKLLAEKLEPGTADISRDMRRPPAFAPAAALSATLDDLELDLEQALDDVPDLELPPPIMPLQRYGHNFLDSHKVIVQILFDTGSKLRKPLRFKQDRRFLSAARMTLTSTGSRDSIPRNLPLPIADSTRIQTFQVDNVDVFSVDFEILPRFGTRVMAKTSALSCLFTEREASRVTLPLLDALMRCAGELEFNTLVIQPYSGKSLEITKYDTYWKSTAFVDPKSLAYPRSHSISLDALEMSFSYVTSFSLRETYYSIPVAITSDKIPVVSTPTISCQGVDLCIASLRFKDLEKLASHPIKRLADYLEKEAPTRQLNLDVPYPTAVEQSLESRIPVQWPSINAYVDEILHVVFAHMRECFRLNKKTKTVMFTSPNPDVCAAFNWKQANYPVFFRLNGLRTDGQYTTANQVELSAHHLSELPVCSSIREASLFAANNNLMGVIIPSRLLRLVPAVVTAVRVVGLVLVASGPDAGAVEGADSVEIDGAMKFPSL